MAAKNTILQYRHYASTYFGANSPGQIMSAIPRYKYMFYAVLNANSQAVTMWPWLSKLGNWQDGVSLKIRTVDKPSVELTQKELNQYNRKRYAYTRTTYRPVNVSIWDTVDNKPFDLWVQYFVYYFGDGRYKSPMTMGSDPTDPTYDDATGWGLRPMTEQINFFTSLDVYALYARTYTKTSYLNPKITAIDWGNHDSAAGELEDLKVSFSYETLQYDTGVLSDAMAAQFGFDVGPPSLEPNGVQAPVEPKRPPDPKGMLTSPATNTSDITAPTNSVLSHFGMSGASYNALVNSNRESLSTNATRTGANGQMQYASDVGANNDIGGYLGEPGYQTYYSDVPLNENIGLLGMPGGFLPFNNTFISLDITDDFMAISALGIYNLLGSFGNFNFGYRQVFSPSGPYNYSYDPVSGLGSVRPGVPNDMGLTTALPIHRPGQFFPNPQLGYYNPYNSYYGNDGRRYRTQWQSVCAARRAVQEGGIGVVIQFGNPYYDDYGVYTGYEDASYQPAPDPYFGPSLSDRAALTNDSTGSFGFLDDPTVFGGDPSDNEPPPTVIPYQSTDTETIITSD